MKRPPCDRCETCLARPLRDREAAPCDQQAAHSSHHAEIPKAPRAMPSRGQASCLQLFSMLYYEKHYSRFIVLELIPEGCNAGVEWRTDVIAHRHHYVANEDAIRNQQLPHGRSFQTCFLQHRPLKCEDQLRIPLGPSKIRQSNK